MLKALKNVPFSLPVQCSQDTVLKMCLSEFRFQIYRFQNLTAKYVPFLRVNWKTYPSHFHRVQNLLASCERGLSRQNFFLLIDVKVGGSFSNLLLLCQAEYLS